MPIFKRFAEIDQATQTDDGLISMVVSTPAPVDMGGWRQALAHVDGSIDTKAARTLLINHDRDQIAGALRDFDNQGDAGLIVNANILDGARTSNGIDVRQAVDSGALKGVSIGYQYSDEDVVFDRETKTAFVRKWRLLEVSLVATPADQDAYVRAIPDQLKDTQDESGETATRSADKGEKMPDPDDTPKAGENTAELDALRKRAQEAEARAERAEMQAKLRGLADQHGVPASVLDFDKIESVEEGLSAMLAHRSTSFTEPKESVAPAPVVTADEADKFIEHASERIGQYRTSEILTKCARYDGERDDVPFLALCQRAISGLSYTRASGPNKLTTSFSALCENTANKQLMGGFDNVETTYEAWTKIKDAKDFNSHDHIGAAIGRLHETPEGEAAKELTQAEGSYSSQLRMWAGTVSISLQALVNDELGEIMASFRRAGAAARDTIEYQAFTALLNATWTNDVTASAPLGTAGNLDQVRSDFRTKLGPAGKQTRNEGRILLVDPTNRLAAETATGVLYGVSTGGNSMTGSNATRSYGVIDSPYVGDTTIFGSAASTDYYLIGNPEVVDTVIVEFLMGQREPMIEEFCAGATGGTNYNIMLPFQATIATYTDSAGNARVAGIQKATA